MAISKWKCWKRTLVACRYCCILIRLFKIYHLHSKIDNSMSSETGMDYPNIPPAVQFSANKQFHSHTQQQEQDRAFIGNSKNIHAERETIKTLMRSANPQSNSSNNDNVPDDLGIRDLASLTAGDLEQFGFTMPSEQNELLQIFSKLPNQDPSYDYICQTDAAKEYNSQIIGNCSNHLMYLRSSLAATNYKLMSKQPEDVIVNEKRYASRFVLEALKSVKMIAEELSLDIKNIEEFHDNAKQKQQQQELQRKSQLKKCSKKLNLLTCIYYSSLALGLSCATWWWWSKHHFTSTPKANLDIISF
ncbi:uncharacterized protein LOC6642392 isoform X2 [Drosophila willistoni]|uniref:uncharacterized protein LOC6642392 isoform X2 n=1 Tax=Drosophila willistoni TaxID=7260 RepID=UPI000C26C3E9|nr:uncharacterized protein LOC6642392 isoform X2 [Drosophila willistoni]